MLLLLAACSTGFSGDPARDPQKGGDTGAPDSPVDSDSAPVDSETGSEDSDTAVVDTDTGPPPDTDTGPPPDTDTGPPDADEDGFPADVDCDDDNPEIHPGAPETWYDDVDQNCDGLSDFDQDHDGHDVDTYITGDDCNDAQPGIYPGAADTWYDGIDSDCAGNDDYDMDADGSEAIPWGEDCSDADATIGPDAIDTYGDTVDTDCSGDGDTPRFHTLQVYDADGMKGPRIAVSLDRVFIPILADSYVEPTTSTTVSTGAVVSILDATDPLGTPTVDDWNWGKSYTYSEGFDFWADDDYLVYAYGLHTSTLRYFMADVWPADLTSSVGVYYADNTENTFEDVEISVDSDDSLQVVACDTSSDGVLRWMHGDAAAFWLNVDVHGDSASTASDACAAVPQEASVYVGKRTSGRVDVFPYNDTTGLGSASPDSTFAPYDMKAGADGGNQVRLVAEGSSGLDVDVGGTSTTLSFASVRTVAYDVDPDGNLWIVAVDDAYGLWLAYGRPGVSFDVMSLDSTLGAVADADVKVYVDKVYIAARSGTEAAYAVLNRP